MTVHIHIYEGTNGPVQARPPIQRAAAPAPQRPAPPKPPPSTPATPAAAKHGPTPKDIALLALARQLSSRGDRLGIKLIDTLHLTGPHASDDELMRVIEKTVASMLFQPANSDG